jgi:hypothetical protein
MIAAKVAVKAFLTWAARAGVVAVVASRPDSMAGTSARKAVRPDGGIEASGCCQQRWLRRPVNERSPG